MSAFVADPVLAKVPASSANLGPGFDCLALALSLADQVEAAVTSSGLRVDIQGEGIDLPRDESHLLVTAARATFDVLGTQPQGLTFRCWNRIPHSRGLGSSAAAIVAGVLVARALVVEGSELLNDTAAMALAAELEGHPDNVAACLLGGLSIAWRDDERFYATKTIPAPGLRVTAYISDQRSSTEYARGILPMTLSHRDAAATAGSAALLVHALCHEPDLLLPASRDWLHQSARAEAMPESAALIEKLRGMGIPAVLSGAGPTVLALGTSGHPAAPLDLPGFTPRPLAIDGFGATVTQLW